MFNRVIRTISATTAAVALTLTATAMSPGVAGATPPSQTPFQCAPGFYQVIANQLKILNPVTGVYNPIGSAYSSNYNALGYNVLDNYLYAVKPTGNASPKLLKIGSGGVVTDLGTPTGVTIPSSNIFTAGDMDTSGHLIAFMTTGKLISINVSTNAASLVSLTKNGSPTTVSESDITWINGNLYGLGGTTLSTINATTGNVSTATVTGLTGEGTTFGATWSDGSDELFVSSNTTGDILKISGYSGGSPSAAKVADGTITSNNDGAACKSATSPFQSPVASDDTYGATTSITLNINAAQGVLSNDTGYGLTTTKMSDPTHGTVTLNADGSFAYVPTNGYSGSDSFTYKDTDSSARTTNTATVSLTVSAGALHSVTYGANGGAGSVPTQGGVSEATTFTVGSGSLLSKAGYTFGGWSDGTSPYAAGASYTMGTADVVLTAQWTPNATDTVTYDSQGGSSVSSGSGLDGASLTVASAPTYPGHTFAGWSTAANGVGTTYSPGDSLSLTGNVTLFAQWTDNATNTVTYNSQGGSSVSSGSGLQGTSLTLASAPTYAGHTFAGWNTLSNGTGTPYAAGASYTLAGNVTLFAQWTSLSACPSGQNFQFRDGQLVNLNVVTGASSPVGSVSTPWINAAGFNPLDGYIYGIQHKGASVRVVRVASNGSVTVVGAPKGLAGRTGLKWTAADMDASGHLIVRITSTSLLSIDVSTLQTTTIPIVSRWGIPMMMFGDDLVFKSGTLYSLHGVTLFAINATTGVLTTSVVAGLNKTPKVDFGSAFVHSGSLYFSRNSDGAIFKVTSSGSGYSATTNASSITVAITDGFSCP